MSEQDQTSRPEVGATVAVRGFSGVACVYLGPQTERGPTERQEECTSCDGSGTDEALDDVYDSNCLECDGAGVVLIIDEEPELVETGRALVRMVGDDRKHVVDFEDLSLIDEDDVCSCGQRGCYSPNKMGG